MPNNETAMRLFNEEDSDYQEILEYASEKPQPVAIYSYFNGDLTWYLVSEIPIDPEDVENMFENKISNYQESDSPMGYELEDGD